MLWCYGYTVLHVQVFASLHARIVATHKAAVISLRAPALTYSVAVIVTSHVISMMTAVMTLAQLDAP